MSIFWACIIVFLSVNAGGTKIMDVDDVKMDDLKAKNRKKRKTHKRKKWSLKRLRMSK